MSTVKDLKDYKDKLYASSTREFEAFEKNFILISSGLLAFSVTFIKEIVKTDEATLLFFLFAGWALIIAAIGLMMWAFLESANASNTLSKYVDTFLESKNKFLPEAGLSEDELKEFKVAQSKIFRNSVDLLKSLRYWAVRTFVAGVISFSFFVGYNLSQEKNRKHKDETKDKNCCCKQAANNTKDTLIIMDYCGCKPRSDNDTTKQTGQQDKGEQKEDSLREQYFKTHYPKQKHLTKWRSKS